MSLLAVVDLFPQNLKWSLVEHICNKMLLISENKHALYTLAKIYAQNNENDKLQIFGFVLLRLMLMILLFL